MSRYQSRTCDIIDRGGRIVLKKGKWYVGHGTDIAGGDSHVQWTNGRHAIEFNDLRLAHLLGAYYGAVVTVRYAKKRLPDGRVDMCPICPECEAF